MRFWVGWALWQKLSFVLAILLVIVLVYSSCVLAHNRRKIRRHAADEAERAERQTELDPILTDMNEIPFGAKALEKGIEVEGIWNSNSIPIPQHTTTPKASKPGKFGSEMTRKRMGSDVDPPVKKHTPESSTKGRDSNQNPGPEKSEAAGCAGLEDIHIDTFQESRSPKLDTHQDDAKSTLDQGRPRPRTWFSPRSSWITKSFDGYKRRSALGGHGRRTSSEDFRRRISRLFDESIQSRPTEMFQLTPIYPESVESYDKKSRDTPFEPSTTVQ